MDDAVFLTHDGLPDTERTWSIDARAAMYTLEACGKGDVWKNRRRIPRLAIRVTARLCKDEHTISADDPTIYLREINDRFCGFITNSKLSRGELMWVDLGKEIPLRALVRVIRVHPYMDEWHECAAAFTTEQIQFASRAA